MTHVDFMRKRTPGDAAMFINEVRPAGRVLGLCLTDALTRGSDALTAAVPDRPLHRRTRDTQLRAPPIRLARWGCLVGMGR